MSSSAASKNRKNTSKLTRKQEEMEEESKELNRKERKEIVGYNKKGRNFVDTTVRMTNESSDVFTWLFQTCTLF